MVKLLARFIKFFVQRCLFFVSNATYFLSCLAFGACIAAFIWIGIQPSDLIVGAWAGTVVAAIWLGSKVSRELAYGVMRFRNTHAADAVPPDTAEEGPLA